ncbi:MAG TPA: glycerophosphodiester phosphodiesterase [Acidimicrobiales bacterium]|jgi:glycerophosphoryl diester phosphodiesterase|nr:glycerophosphodiester phosphodiesterase [Acidimicrobiales bacterium]
MTAIFAHRGCTGVPTPRENTLAAFAAARRAGADGVELDARATADGALAVHHDRHVPGVGDITNALAAELPTGVPLLDDALVGLVGLRVNVEIKGGPREAALVARLLLARAEDPSTEATGVFVSSFDPAAVAAVAELAPPVSTGLLVDWRTDVRDALDHAVRLGCATLHPFVTQVDADLVAGARSRGLGLHVWTVNADADIAAMGGLGVDAIITDRVPAAVAILRQGG